MPTSADRLPTHVEPVEDESGRRFLLQKRSSDSWLLLDPDSGETLYRDPEELTVLTDASPLETAAASAVPEPVRRLLLAVRSDRALGLVITVADRGPIAVRTLLAETTLCESDLHGQLAELVAAGLLQEARVAGERGYETTSDGDLAVEILRDAGSADA